MSATGVSRQLTVSADFRVGVLYEESGAGMFEDVRPEYEMNALVPKATLNRPWARITRAYPENDRGARGIAMTQATVTASVVMFSVPFLLVAACYAALPDEFTVLRSPMAGAVLLAPKSVFTVFRVPLMNLTHGLMAAVMLSRTPDFKDAQRRGSYFRVFLTLLFAVALKSNFEALEMSSLAWSFGPVAPWLTRGTVVSIIGGLGLAFRYARGVPIPWPELRLNNLGKITLTSLFAAYLAIVTATLLVSHRG